MADGSIGAVMGLLAVVLCKPLKQIKKIIAYQVIEVAVTHPGFAVEPPGVTVAALGTVGIGQAAFESSGQQELLV